MSPRRFFAYFLAVSAGSTVAFAPVLRGQPAPSAAGDGAMGRAAADDGADALPPETVRLYQAMKSRRHHRPDLKAAH